MTRARMQLVACAATCLLAAALATPSAAAAQPTTQITSVVPSGPYLLDNQVTGNTTITVRGTATGLANLSTVDLDCYYGDDYSILVRGVAVQNGAFTWTGSMNGSGPGQNGIAELTCVLRAVPPAYEGNPYPPGDTSAPFSGPTLNVDLLNQTLGGGPSGNQLLDYFFNATQPLGAFAFQSLGDCPIDGSWVYAPVTFTQSEIDFCNGGFGWENGRTASDSPPTAAPGYQLPYQSEIEVDGDLAYTAGMFTPASALNSLSGENGFPSLSYQPPRVNASNGDVTLDETDELVRCLPGNMYPPDSTDCGSFGPTGVDVHLHEVQSDQGRLVALTQTFYSTDDSSHDLVLLEDNEFIHAPPSGGGQGGLFFPWVSSGMEPYTIPGGPNVAPIPGPPGAGPGSFYAEASIQATPGPYDALAGVTFSTPPTNETIVATTNSPAQGPNLPPITWVDLNYKKVSVPKTGGVALGFAYFDALTLGELESDATAAQAQFTPTLTVTSPRGRVTIRHQRQVTVTGSASDAYGLAGVTPDGQAAGVTVDGNSVAVRNGHFRTTVALPVGVKKITVVATNVFGNRATVMLEVLRPGRPRISGLRQAHRRWREAGSPGQAPLGTTFSLKLNEPARVTFTFSGPSVGSLTRSLPAGLSVIQFAGSLHGRGLHPGSYKVTIVARYGRFVSSPAHLVFTIVN